MWDSDVLMWKTWLSAYDDAIRAAAREPNKSDLCELDTFLWSELPPVVLERNPPHLLHEEYERIVRWKLTRGKPRPRLIGFAKALSAAEVREASEAAFAALDKATEAKFAPDKVRTAVQALVKLKGCGPATASAILAAVQPEVPLMSDELLDAALGTDNRKYTLVAYMGLYKTVRAKAEELSSADPSHDWTPRDVEWATFASVHTSEIAGKAGSRSAATLPFGGPSVPPQQSHERAVDVASPTRNTKKKASTNGAKKGRFPQTADASVAKSKSGSKRARKIDTKSHLGDDSGEKNQGEEETEVEPKVKKTRGTRRDSKKRTSPSANTSSPLMTRARTTRASQASPTG